MRSGNFWKQHVELVHIYAVKRALLENVNSQRFWNKCTSLLTCLADSFFSLFTLSFCQVLIRRFWREMDWESVWVLLGASTWTSRSTVSHSWMYYRTRNTLSQSFQGRPPRWERITHSCDRFCLQCLLPPKIFFSSVDVGEWIGITMVRLLLRFLILWKGTSLAVPMY